MLLMDQNVIKRSHKFRIVTSSCLIHRFLYSLLIIFSWISSSSLTKNKKCFSESSNIGPIVGGVVGGIVGCHEYTISSSLMWSIGVRECYISCLFLSR